MQAAKFLAALEAGNYSLEEILLHTPWSMGHCRLWTVMMRTPHFGEAGIRKCLGRAKVYPMVRLDNMTESDKKRVIDSLPPRARASGM